MKTSKLAQTAFTSLALLATALPACIVEQDTGRQVSDVKQVGPGSAATDARVPELGSDPKIAKQSKITMGDAIAQVTAQHGPVIEAKFELDHSNQLSLSLYPVADLALDAQRNVFQELAADPRVTPFAGGLEQFHDQEHLTRSSRDLTLVQLSDLGIADAVKAMPQNAFVYWAIPTIRYGRAGYGVYYLTKTNQNKYKFVDGQGSDEHNWTGPEDLGAGPGDGATDTRTPELGDDLSVVWNSSFSMGDALAWVEENYGPTIEAKFELDHDGKLSLSVYPVSEGLEIDAERQKFFELAADPTGDEWAPELVEFQVPDEEHLTRSARDLTLVQTASLSLLDAVYVAEWEVPGGFVYWAIPTIRGTRSGYGVYVLDQENQVHYFFIS
jgi:hypothetical protein